MYRKQCNHRITGSHRSYRWSRWNRIPGRLLPNRFRSNSRTLHGKPWRKRRCSSSWSCKKNGPDGLRPALIQTRRRNCSHRGKLPVLLPAEVERIKNNIMNTKAVKIHTEFYSFLRIQKIAKSNFFHHHKISQINSTPFYLLFLHNFITSSFSTATKENRTQSPFLFWMPSPLEPFSHIPKRYSIILFNNFSFPSPRVIIKSRKTSK